MSLRSLCQSFQKVFRRSSSSFVFGNLCSCPTLNITNIGKICEHFQMFIFILKDLTTRSLFRFSTSHFCSRQALLPRGPRFAMPKGWTRAPVLDGWVQIVRGPRPKQHRGSFGEFEAQPVSRFDQGCCSNAEEVEGVPPFQQASRPPDAVAAEASAEVQRLEAAMSVLGENNPHALPLKEVLRVARAKSKVLPCKEFIEREPRSVSVAPRPSLPEPTSSAGGRSPRASHSSDLGFAATN